MRSLLLSLDPPAAPAVVATPISAAWSFVESYGWFMLFGGLALYFAFKQYQEWAVRRRRAARQAPDDAAHAEEVAMKVRQTRLAQQAAWVAAAPSAHRVSRALTDEERRLQHLYGVKPQPAEPDADRLTMDEVFGSNLDTEFYKGLAKRKNGKPRDDSSSSSSSSSSSKSGFNPYKGGGSDKGGGSRRFGSGGPKKGG